MIYAPSLKDTISIKVGLTGRLLDFSDVLHNLQCEREELAVGAASDVLICESFLTHRGVHQFLRRLTRHEVASNVWRESLSAADRAQKKDFVVLVDEGLQAITGEHIVAIDEDHDIPQGVFAPGKFLLQFIAMAIDQELHKRADRYRAVDLQFLLASAQAARQIVNGCDHYTRHEEVSRLQFAV